MIEPSYAAQDALRQVPGYNATAFVESLRPEFAVLSCASGPGHRIHAKIISPPSLPRVSNACRPAHATLAQALEPESEPESDPLQTGGRRLLAMVVLFIVRGQARWWRRWSWRRRRCTRLACSSPSILPTRLSVPCAALMGSLEATTAGRNAGVRGHASPDRCTQSWRPLPSYVPPECGMGVPALLLRAATSSAHTMAPTCSP